MRRLLASARPLAASAGAGLTGVTLSFSDAQTNIPGTRFAKPPLHCEDDFTNAHRANAVLSDRHRVGLCSWPVSGAVFSGDSRVSSLSALFQHARAAGYDGLEMHVGQFRDFYFKDSAMTDMEIAELAKKTALEQGSEVLGALYLITDGPGTIIPEIKIWTYDFNEEGFEETLRDKMRADKAMGARYITFQVSLPGQYLGTPFEWRDDDAFCEKTVQRLCKLADICWDEGLNAYFETHIDRVSEDPVFFRRVLLRAASAGYRLEVNGDLSHYIYRGFLSGRAIEDILSCVNHMHVRMARVHGDLSAEVEDFDKDIETNGPASAAWAMTERVSAARAGSGLSSRVVCGETGPMHLVQDALSHDQRMVPFLRKMASALDDSRLPKACPA